MARTTPAQNPRGWAKTTFMASVLVAAVSIASIFIASTVIIPITRQLRRTSLVPVDRSRVAPSSGDLAGKMHHFTTNISAERFENLGADGLGIETCRCIHQIRAVMIDKHVR